MKYEVIPTTRFRKDLKLAAKRGLKVELLSEVIKKLAQGEMHEEGFLDHSLKGDYAGCRECHISPDWLLNL